MKKILIVVDMQNDFIDGALGTKEAQAIVDNVVAKMGEYTKDRIYVTRDTHQENYLETQEGCNLPVVHCIKNSEGWQIDSRVQQAMGEVTVIDKPTFGSCLLADHVAKLAEKEELEITLCGLCTDICVVSNALLLKAIDAKPAQIPAMFFWMDSTFFCRPASFGKDLSESSYSFSYFSAVSTINVRAAEVLG